MIDKPPECFEENHEWRLLVKGLPLGSFIRRDDIEVIEETYCNVWRCRTCLILRFFVNPQE